MPSASAGRVVDESIKILAFFDAEKQTPDPRPAFPLLT